MAPSPWSIRFGYARWLRHLETGEAPAFADIGREVERTGQAVSGWAKAAEPPTDFRVHAPLARYLGVSERWLVHAEGDPPRPDLWAVWSEVRRGATRAPTATGYTKLSSAAKTAKKKKA